MKQTSLLRKLWLPLVLVAACMHLQAQHIIIGGNEYSFDNSTDKVAAEGWKWDSGAKTLTLHSTYAKGPISINSFILDGGIQLVYSGNVTINGGASPAINCIGDLAIGGSTGTLALSSEGDICLTGNLTINSGTVTVDGDIEGDLYVNNTGTNVTVNGDIRSNLVLNGGTVFITGKINYIENNGGTLRGGEKQAATTDELTAAMESLITYTTITLGNSITLDNYQIIMKADQTLTIPDGTTLTINDEAYIDTGGHTLSINGKGTANIENTTNRVIYGDGTLDLTGVTLSLKDTEYFTLSELDINVNTGATLTVDAPDVNSLILINEGKTLTVDGGTLNIKSFASNGIYILNNGTLDIKQSGKLTIGEGEEYDSCAISNEGTLILGCGVGNITRLGNNCAIYLYEGSKVEVGTIKFTDQGKQLSTDKPVTVGAETADASADGLTQGVYIYNPNNSNFCKEGIIITTHPEDATVIKGKITGSLTVAGTATNGEKVAYQWCKDPGDNSYPVIAGATGSTFTIPTNLAAGTYKYICKLSATGCLPAWSETATVTVSDTSAGTIQIGNRTVEMAGDAKDADNGWSWNATASTLTLDAGYKSGNCINIDGNTDAAITLAFTGDVTIDAEGENAPLTFSGSSLTIQDADGQGLKSAGGNTLTLKGYAAAGLVMAAGSLAIESGTVTASSQDNNAIYIAEGNLTVGGTAWLYAKSLLGDHAALYMHRGGNVTLSTSRDCNFAGSGVGIKANGNLALDLTGSQGILTVSGRNGLTVLDGSLSITGAGNDPLTILTTTGAGLLADKGISITGDAKVTVGSSSDAKEKENVTGNLTVGGSGTEVQINGKVTGDLTVTGGTVTVTGEVTGDKLVTGGTVTVNNQTVDKSTAVMDISALTMALQSTTPSTIILGQDITTDGQMIAMGAAHTLVIPTGTTLTIDRGHINTKSHALTLKGSGTVDITQATRTATAEIYGEGDDATLNLGNITVNLKNSSYGGLRDLDINVNAGGTIRLDSETGNSLLSIASGKTLAINQGGTVDIVSFKGTGISNNGTLLINQGGTLSIAKGEGYNCGVNNVGLLEKAYGGTLSMQPGGAVYLYEDEDRASQVKGFAGKFSDRDKAFTTDDEVTVKADTEDPIKDALTAGLYIYNSDTGKLTKHIITYTKPQREVTVTQGSITGSLTIADAATTNGAAVTCQWYKYNSTSDDDIIAGATSKTFAIPTGLAAGEYKYYCLLSAEGCESVKSDFTVTVEPGTATPGAYHTVALTLAPGITCNYAAGNLGIAEGEKLHLTFSADDATLTAADILFIVDGKETAFNTASGSSSYLFNPAAANHTVVIALREYAVTLPEIEGLTVTAAGKAAYGKPFTFTLSSETLDLSGMIVYANGEVLDPTTPPLRAAVPPSFWLRPIFDSKAGSQNSYSYTIEKVTGPITITIEGINPTGNADIAGGKVSIATRNGQLTIDNSTGQAVDVAVYTIAGKNVVLLRALSGSRTIPLAAGIYIVKAGTEVHKVVVN